MHNYHHLWRGRIYLSNISPSPSWPFVLRPQHQTSVSMATGACVEAVLSSVKHDRTELLMKVYLAKALTMTEGY